MILPLHLNKEWPVERLSDSRKEQASFTLRLHPVAVKPMPNPLQEPAHSDNVGVSLRLSKSVTCQ